MVRVCSLNELKGNEILAKDILNQECCITLMTAGDKLQTNSIARLKEFGISQVCIEEEENDFVDDQIEILANTTKEILKSKIKIAITRHTFGYDDALNEMNQIADKIISEISEIKEVKEHVFEIKEHSNSLYEHTLNVCSLSILLGIKMDLSIESLHDIGVGSLLHDIGIQYLNFDYHDTKISEFSNEEKIDYERHTVYGYSLLSEQKWLSETSKKIVLYHHEKIDGSGFPMHIRRIPLEVAIVEVCDVFDEMVCGMGYNQQKTYQAIEYLKTNINIKYNLLVTKTFINFIAVFPIGTHVKTNENEIAIVLRQNKNFPDRPIIKIIQNRNGQQTEGNMIKDLLQEKTVFIDEIIEKNNDY